MLEKSTEKKRRNVPQVLVIGGLDPTGGAGILLDARAVSAAGAHAAAVATVITAQRNTDFAAQDATGPRWIREAVETTLTATEIGAVKTGAFGSGAAVRALAGLTTLTEFPPLIVDPVIQSTSGGTLLDNEGVAALRLEIIPVATFVTPNLAEASTLVSAKVESVDDMKRAAAALLKLGPKSVLIKGGHLQSERVVDVFQDSTGDAVVLENQRIGKHEVRGTGCALASLIAAFIARGFARLDAVFKAKDILTKAIGASVCAGPGPRFLRFD